MTGYRLSFIAAGSALSLDLVANSNAALSWIKYSHLWTLHTYLIKAGIGAGMKQGFRRSSRQLVAAEARDSMKGGTRIVAVSECSSRHT